MYYSSGDRHGDRGHIEESPDPLGRDDPDSGGSQRKNPKQLDDSLTVYWDHKEFFFRLANLWNGEEVRDQYLLTNGELPTWDQLFGDLDEDRINDIRYGPGSADPYVKSTYINRQKVHYDLTEKGRTLLNNHYWVNSTLKGDPFESLTHRVGVFLGFCWTQMGSPDRVVTYASLDGYTLDILAIEDDQPILCCEVITDHNNYDLYRDTHRKCLTLLHKERIPSYLLFDTRETAYEYYNVLHDSGLIKLPRGRFESYPRIEWGRSHIRELYSEFDGFPIRDWRTIANTIDLIIPEYLNWHLSEDWYARWRLTPLSRSSPSQYPYNWIFSTPGLLFGYSVSAVLLPM